MDEVRTTTGLGSDGIYSQPDNPVCAGCGKPIDGKPVWEVGAQWHPECLPPGWTPGESTP